MFFSGLGLLSLGALGAMLSVPGDSLRSFRVLVTLPGSAVGGEILPFDFRVREVGGSDTAVVRTQFRGPQQ